MGQAWQHVPYVWVNAPYKLVNPLMSNRWTYWKWLGDHCSSCERVKRKAMVLQLWESMQI